MTTAHLTYGESLPDQVEHVAGLSDAQSYIFNDIRDLYRDRAYLEREYATKLQALGKKAVEKKARKMSAAVVGAEPTKAWSEETLNASTIEATYAQVISSILTTAQDHIDLADALNMQVIEPLRTLERRNEDHRKKLAAFYQKLLSDRDRVFSERSKAKQKYDAECEEVEEYRQKQDRASDDKHVERAARQFEQQKADMLNAKNVYLITIATANTVQSRFYKDSLPALENQHQLLQTQTAKQFVELMKHAQELQATNQDVLKSRVKAVESALSQVDPPKDQALFIEHNVRPFTEPSGYQFQPSQSHYDTADMNIESAPKIYLQNRLSKMRGKLQELLPLAETKRKEADQAMGVLVAYSNNRSLGSVADAMDAYLETHHQATLYEESKAILETEIKLLEDALRGDEGSQSPHQFKSSPFTIPTECAYCRTNIWGLSKQGKTCKLCGLSVHAKCELKVAADCTRTRGGGKIKSESSLSRSVSSVSTTSSVLSTRSITLTPTPSSFAQNRSPEEDDRVKARVLFSFSPTSPFELAVQESTIVMIIEEDDGSGWVKVDDGRGGKGLVPASYIEPADESTPNTPTAAATVANSAGSGIRVKGLYDYQATGTDELDVTVGGIIELTPGGDNYAEGWWEGIDSSGKKGIFPSNYVAPV